MKNNLNIDMSLTTAPSFPRRLAAILYDTVLVFGLLLLASMVVTLPVGLLIGESASTALSANLLFRLWLALVPPAFFLLFWLKGGQTLGMRTWRLRVVRKDGAPLRWTDALKRLLFAALSWLPLGLGFFWVLVDREHQAWHDRLSGTRLILLAKP